MPPSARPSELCFEAGQRRCRVATVLGTRISPERAPIPPRQRRSTLVGREYQPVTHLQLQQLCPPIGHVLYATCQLASTTTEPTTAAPPSTTTTAAPTPTRSGSRPTAACPGGVGGTGGSGESAARGRPITLSPRCEPLVLIPSLHPTADAGTAGPLQPSRQIRATGTRQYHQDG
jgi:hypothetical protein